MNAMRERTPNLRAAVAGGFEKGSRTLGRPVEGAISCKCRPARRAAAGRSRPRACCSSGDDRAIVTEVDPGTDLRAAVTSAVLPIPAGPSTTAHPPPTRNRSVKTASSAARSTRWIGSLTIKAFYSPPSGAQRGLGFSAVTLPVLGVECANSGVRDHPLRVSKTPLPFIRSQRRASVWRRLAPTTHSKAQVFGMSSMRPIARFGSRRSARHRLHTGSSSTMRRAIAWPATLAILAAFILAPTPAVADEGPAISDPGHGDQARRGSPGRGTCSPGSASRDIRPLRTTV